MAVIVSNIAPSHIGAPHPTPTPLQLAISSSTEFATPRSLHGIDIVTAATVLTPLSNPISDPTASSEYRLSTKRSHDDSEDDDFSVGPESKRLKLEGNDDSLFVHAFQNAAIITNDAQFFGVAIDDTLTPTYYSLPFQPPLPISAIAPDFFFSSDIPPETNELPLSPESSLVPEQHVATAFQGESAPEVPVADDEDAEGEVDDEYPILFRATPSMLGYIPIAHRRTEPPLWKSACQARVDHIKALYGIEAIRATVDREAREANAQLTAGSPSSPSSEASASPCSSPTTPSAELTVHDITVIHLEEASLPETEALKVEICTPSDFSSVEPKIEMESKVTDSELVLADEDSIMDTTFDWDEDSDEDDDFDFDLESEVDIDDAMTSPHESLVSFPDIPYTSNQTRTYTPNLALSLLQLPRLSDIPVYPFYGGYQEMEPHGTPARRPDHAAGSLLHA